MDVGYGGKQEIPHPSKLSAACLGPHSPRLKVDDEQCFFYSLTCEVLTKSAGRQLARKARSHKRAYRSGESNEHADLEHMVK